MSFRQRWHSAGQWARFVTAWFALLRWLRPFLLLLNRLCPQVAKLISPAGGCSPAFVRGFLELLQCPHTVAALRGDHARQDKSAVHSWLDGVDSARFGAVSID